MEFLFGKVEVNQDQPSGFIPNLNDQIQILKSQVDSLLSPRTNSIRIESDNVCETK